MLSNSPYVKEIIIPTSSKRCKKVKKALLYLFLFTYSTVMFRSILPYIKDAIAHVLFYKDHMLTVHAHNGKFHVHAEMAKAAKNDTSNKSTNSLKKDLSDNEHIILESYKFPTSKILINWMTCLSYPTINASIDHDFPPPKYVSL